MRSDPKGFSAVSAPLTAEAQALGARTLRRSGWLSELLRSTRGPVLLVQRGRCGAPGGSGHFSSQTRSSTGGKVCVRVWEAARFFLLVFNPSTTEGPTLTSLGRNRTTIEVGR